MTERREESDQRFADAVLAARLLALDPDRLGGIAVRARPGPVRDAWTEFGLEALGPDTPRVRLPPGVTAESLTGHFDLAASLAAGAPVRSRGLIERSRAGLMVVPMAERLATDTAALLALALERGGAGGGSRDHSASEGFGVLLFDESEGDEPAAAHALLDRLAFHVNLDGISLGAALSGIIEAPEAEPGLRARLMRVEISDAAIEAIAEAVVKLGIPSMRAALLAAQVARCHAALSGRESVEADDLAAAGRLVLASRARQLPESEPQREEQEPQEEPGEGSSSEGETEKAPDTSLDNIILQAVSVRLPPKLLEAPHRKPTQRSTGKTGARSSAGDVRLSLLHGRPAGVRRGALRDGVRLSVYETLRAAAPWQLIRRQQRAASAAEGHAAVPAPKFEIRTQDLRLKRFTGHAVTTTIFALDASGSAAAQRLAEAKGAVELFLNECYVRRDQVALISFRGTGAEVLVPPTRSLTRARRLLTALPGGGGTPLACGLQAACALAETLRRQGQTPLLVVLTDGRANVALDGSGGRARAAAEATTAARTIAARGLRSLLLDVSMRGTPEARALAEAMDARYLLIPGAEAQRVAGAVSKARKDLQAGA